MTDPSNVFETSSIPQGDPQQTAPASPNLFTDQLTGITNEDGTQKYNSVEDALKGAKHAQEFIPQLKSQLSEKDVEINELKAKLEQQGTLEEVVSRLAAPSQPSEGLPASTAGLDEESVMQLFDKRRAQEQADINEQAVSGRLVEKYGDKAGEVLQAKAKELGTTVQELQSIARTNPTMAMTFFQTTPTQNFSTTTSSVHMPESSGGSETAPIALDLLKGSREGRVSQAFLDAKARTLKELNIQ